MKKTLTAVESSLVVDKRPVTSTRTSSAMIKIFKHIDFLLIFIKVMGFLILRRDFSLRLCILASLPKINLRAHAQLILSSKMIEDHS